MLAARVSGARQRGARARALAQLRNESTAVQRLRAPRQLALGSTRGFFTRKPEPVPLVQALVVDKFGRQQRVECKVKPTPTERENEEMLRMAKWAAALLASGACLASAFGENGQAHAASSGGAKNSDSEDIVELLKKKVKTFTDENLASLQKLLPDQLGDVQKHVDEFLASGKGGQISWGFMMGACSGFALKKVSKVGAVALGSVFILFQCASYAGYIDVNHKKIEKDVMGVLDLNKDGQFDSKDVDDAYKKVMKVLEYSLPAGSGFAVGFLVGFRAG